MMTKKDGAKEIFSKTIKKLEEVLQQEKTEVIRDSAIKRFELCFDASWKLIKADLENKKGVLCSSPNDCFKEAYRQGFIAYDDEWVKMAKQRNFAVHTYGEEFADALYKKLPEFLKLFKELEKNLD